MKKYRIFEYTNGVGDKEYSVCRRTLLFFWTKINWYEIDTLDKAKSLVESHEYLDKTLQKKLTGTFK